MRTREDIAAYRSAVQLAVALKQPARPEAGLR
jgi:hypothetical protein